MYHNAGLTLIFLVDWRVFGLGRLLLRRQVQLSVVHCSCEFVQRLKRDTNLLFSMLLLMLTTRAEAERVAEVVLRVVWQLPVLFCCALIGPCCCMELAPSQPSALLHTSRRVSPKIITTLCWFRGLTAASWLIKTVKMFPFLSRLIKSVFMLWSEIETRSRGVPVDALPSLCYTPSS